MSPSTKFCACVPLALGIARRKGRSCPKEGVAKSTDVVRLASEAFLLERNGERPFPAQLGRPTSAVRSPGRAWQHVGRSAQAPLARRRKPPSGPQEAASNRARRDGNAPRPRPQKPPPLSLFCCGVTSLPSCLHLGSPPTRP